MAVKALGPWATPPEIPVTWRRETVTIQEQQSQVVPLNENQQEQEAESVPRNDNPNVVEDDVVARQEEPAVDMALDDRPNKRSRI
mmetsp:Transcript_32902/g.79600  ORF Transcript_32902/g.79600 Transcript_32902/m.79600 type:complete len:85 (+) Transcript_32902:641-895(+)